MPTLKKTKKAPRRRRAPAQRIRKSRYFCIVAWHKGGLIPWFWGGHLKWGPASHAVFFMREEDARHEAVQIRDIPPSEGGGLPQVVDVKRLNRKHGLAVAPQPELVR